MESSSFEWIRDEGTERLFMKSRKIGDKKNYIDRLKYEPYHSTIVTIERPEKKPEKNYRENYKYRFEGFLYVQYHRKRFAEMLKSRGPLVREKGK